MSCLLLQEKEQEAEPPEEGREVQWDAPAFIWQEMVDLLDVQGTDIPALQVTGLGLLPSGVFLRSCSTQRQKLAPSLAQHGWGAVWMGGIAS